MRLTDSLKIQWEVGGCFDVDETSLMWGRFPSESEVNVVHSAWDTWHDWTNQVRELNLIAGHSETTLSGSSRWDQVGTPNFMSQKSAPFLPQFEQNISISTIWQDLTNAGLVSDTDLEVDVFIMSTARVDSFMMQQNNPEPNVVPQSHFVNARLRDDWDQQVGEHRVQGHSEWLSAPIKLHLIRNVSSSSSDDDHRTTTESPESTTTQGCNTRGGILCTTIVPWEQASTVTPGGDNTVDDGNSNAVAAFFLAFSMILLIVLFAYGYTRWTVRKREGLYRVVETELERKDDDEDMETGIYEDEDDGVGDDYEDDDGDEVEI